MTWKCHARPAALGGATCGHVNAGEPVLARVGGSPRPFECCQGCGCTRKASDDRQRKL